MANNASERRWYTEPETFIAAAALIVSVSAVVVGLYETHLQREHDRAEVWPHLELGTYTSPQGAKVTLSNAGIGPAVIHSVIVAVDGQARHNWPDVVQALFGKPPSAYDNATAADRALRAGDQIELVGLRSADLPKGFWTYAKRVTVRICYSSVFGESWMLNAQLGALNQWTSVDRCDAQPAGMDF